MREALKLALEALEDNQHLVADNERHAYVMEYNDLIEKCKEALAQPEQELLAWKNAALRVGEDLSSVGPKGYYNMTAQQWLDWAMAQQPRGNNSLAQPEQEPVAWLIDNDYTTVFFEIADVHRSKGKKVEPLYTIPPQRTWVGLTREEAKEICLANRPYVVDMVIALEAELKKRNGFTDEENT